MIRFIKSVCYFLLIIVLALAGLFGYVRHDVGSHAVPLMYQDSKDVPVRPVAMVMGAEVLPSQVPSEALAKRLDAAIGLYKSGKVTTLLMSGDGRSIYYNEVQVMAAYAAERGVPESAMILDKSGLRTYDSCLRARTEYEISKLIIVTQRDHLERAIYTCQKLDVDAVGFVAPEFSGAGRLRYLLREQAALLLAWIELNLFRS